MIAQAAYLHDPRLQPIDSVRPCNPARPSARRSLLVRAAITLKAVFEFRHYTLMNFGCQ
jgi:hypothetical protein